MLPGSPSWQAAGLDDVRRFKRPPDEHTTGAFQAMVSSCNHKYNTDTHTHTHKRSGLVQCGVRGTALGMCTMLICAHLCSTCYDRMLCYHLVAMLGEGMVNCNCADMQKRRRQHHKTTCGQSTGPKNVNQNEPTNNIAHLRPPSAQSKRNNRLAQDPPGRCLAPSMHSPYLQDRCWTPCVAKTAK
jgi:hypothetical protein